MLGLLKPYASFIQRAAEAPGAMRTHTVAVLLQWRANAHLQPSCSTACAPVFGSLFRSQCVCPTAVNTCVDEDFRSGIPERATERNAVRRVLIHPLERTVLNDGVHPSRRVALGNVNGSVFLLLAVFSSFGGIRRSSHGDISAAYGSGSPRASSCATTCCMHVVSDFA
jgi:hypothetical protein